MTASPFRGFVASREIENHCAIVVDAAYHLHRRLGPGLLESVYEALLARQIEARGLAVERQKVVAFEFDGIMHGEMAVAVNR